MTYYVIHAHYSKQALYQENWIVDTIEEVELESDFIEANGWTIDWIMTVTEAK